MSRVQSTRYLVDVTPDMLDGNPDAHTTPDGRALLSVRTECPTCRKGRRWALPLGTWAIDHAHGGVWTVHQVRAEPAPKPRPLDQAAAWADARTLARAAR